MSHLARFGISAFIVFTLGTAVSGCAYMGHQSDGSESETPQPQLSTTAKGAITGTAIGAGLGLALGSTTGNAGEGLLIGSAAGAAAGGLVGREIETQDEQIAGSQEKISRQGEVIERQQRQIDEIKRNLDGQFSEHNVTSTGSATFDSYRGSPNARPFRMSEEPEQMHSRSRMGRVAQPFSEQSFNERHSQVARREPTERNPFRADTPTAVERAASAPRPFEAAKPFEAARNRARAVAEEPVREVAPAIESTNDSLDVAEVGSGREQEQVKQLEQEVIAEDRSLARIDEQREAQSSSSEPVGVLPPAKKSASEQKFDDPNCARAGEEAERARKAPSEADKLFYFRRAIRLCPSNPAYHVEIAAVYQGIGRPEDAEVELKEAVELDPQNADAKSALAAIEAMAHEEIN